MCCCCWVPCGVLQVAPPQPSGTLALGGPPKQPQQRDSTGRSSRRLERQWQQQPLHTNASPAVVRDACGAACAWQQQQQHERAAPPPCTARGRGCSSCSGCCRCLCSSSSSRRGGCSCGQRIPQPATSPAAAAAAVRPRAQAAAGPGVANHQQHTHRRNSSGRPTPVSVSQQSDRGVARGGAAAAAAARGHAAMGKDRQFKCPQQAGQQQPHEQLQRAPARVWLGGCAGSSSGGSCGCWQP